MPSARVPLGMTAWGESPGISRDPDGSGIWVYGVYSTEGQGVPPEANPVGWGTWLEKVVP